MDNLYALASNVKYRREWFGGLIYSDFSKTTRFFNHAAAFAIEQFAKQTSIALAQNKLNQLLCAPNRSRLVFYQS